MRAAGRVVLVGSLLAGCRAAPAPAEQVAEQAAEPAAPAPAEVVDEPTAPAPAEPVAEPTPPPAAPAPCKVEQLHAGSHPNALAVDATHLYFVEDSRLFRLPRTGGEPQPLIDRIQPELPVLGDDWLIACRRDKRLDVDLLRVAKDGSSTVAIGKADACKLARHGGQLYMPVLVDGHKPWFARMSEAGGEVEHLLELDRQIAEIAADGSHVFFTTGRDDLYRFDPTTRTSTKLASERAGMMEFGMTDTQLAWLEYGNLMRLPKSGPPTQPQVVANFQDVLTFAGSGDDLYWASVGDSGWRRLSVAPTAAPSAANATLRSFAVPAGSSSIAVDGKRVFWNSFDKRGGIFTLDTTTCGDDVLVPSPAIRAIVGPEHEDTLRYGSADAGEVIVEVRDLSSEEELSLEQLAVAHGYERPPANADKLPPRFAIGDRYRVATTAGVFDASLTGFELGSGGEGLHFYLVLRIADATSSAALASKVDAAKLGPLRDGGQTAELPAKYLEAVRAAFNEAGLDGKRVDVDALQIVRGRFPAPHVALIAVELSPPEGEGEGDDDDHNLNYLSALLLGDVDGKISGEVYAPDERLDHFTIGHLVDVDGDGIDEVLVGSAYYEGSYVHLLEWHDGHTTRTTLAGDGA